MSLKLPDLPASFADCAENIVAGPAPPDFISLDHLLASEGLERGFAGLLGKWGPGDRRAVVSLWTQGYFGRLFRPLLAYGLIHDIWFRTDIDAVSVGLSELGIPVRFALDPTSRLDVQTHIEGLVRNHVEPLIERLAARTGGSTRIHWSNASFAFHRAVRQVVAADQPASAEAVAERLLAVEEMMSGDHPLFRLTEFRDGDPAESRPVRRVCCIRFKLDGLRKCKTACPIRDDQSAELSV